MTDLSPSSATVAFEEEVRRAAPDLWLASRLVADPRARAALLASYAVHGELSKVSSAATNALAGEIRLAWWREEVERLLTAGGQPLGHPALQALAGRPGLDQAALAAMIEARHAELEPRPFADEAQVLSYLDHVDGGLMRAAAGLLSPGLNATLTQTGRAWGWTRLLHERPLWRARGRDWTPIAWGESSDVEIAGHVRHRAADALNAAKVEVAALPVAVFPAVAYVTLASVYARGRRPGDLEKRARLLWASLRGQV